MSVLAPGTPVPSFKLATEDGEHFTERDLQGERTVLVFYPFASAPVCTDQLQLYEPLLGELPGWYDEAYGVSCDSTGPTGVQGEARRQHRAAVGLRAQGATCRRSGPARRRFPERRWSRSTPMQSCAGAIRQRDRASCPASSAARGVGIASAMPSRIEAPPPPAPVVR